MLSLAVALIWTFMVGFDLFLFWEMVVRAPREVLEWEMVKAWKRHFQENVASSWVFYDGLGG